MKRRGFLKALGCLLPLVPLVAKGELVKEPQNELDEDWLVDDELRKYEPYCYKERPAMDYPSYPDVRPAMTGSVSPGHCVDTTFFCNDTCSKGTVVECDSSDYNGDLVYPGNHGSPPVGIIANDVVDLDLTRRTINSHICNVQIGGKVCVITKGNVIVNCVGNPKRNDPIYYDGYGMPTTLPISKQIGICRQPKHSYSIEDAPQDDFILMEITI